MKAYNVTFWCGFVLSVIGIYFSKDLAWNIGFTIGCILNYAVYTRWRFKSESDEEEIRP